MWDLTHKKQYHNICAGDKPIEMPIGKEHDDWDSAPYMDILPDVSTQGK